MKPHAKIDSWCYSTTKKSARKKLKRLRTKGRRQAEAKIVRKEQSIKLE